MCTGSVGSNSVSETEYVRQCICALCQKVFFASVPLLASYIFLNFQIEPELGTGINPGMAFTPFPCSILNETRFEPTPLVLELSLTTTRPDFTPLTPNSW